MPAKRLTADKLRTAHDAMREVVEATNDPNVVKAGASTLKLLDELYVAALTGKQ